MRVRAERLRGMPRSRALEGVVDDDTRDGFGCVGVGNTLLDAQMVVPIIDDKLCEFFYCNCVSIRLPRFPGQLDDQSRLRKIVF